MHIQSFIARLEVRTIDREPYLTSTISFGDLASPWPLARLLIDLPERKLINARSLRPVYSPGTLATRVASEEEDQ